MPMRDCLKNLGANAFDRPNDNLYQEKNHRRLSSILKNGYSFKHQEKKQYYAQRSEAANLKVNQEMLSMSLNSRSILSFAQQKASQKDLAENLSNSSQNLYAELFTDRCIKLTQSIVGTLQEDTHNKSRFEGVTEARVTEELNKAKKNKMYKELGMNLNLKEIFQGFNYDDLMKLRKLHVLHATQKSKQLSSQENKQS